SPELRRLFLEDADAVLRHVQEALVQLGEGVDGADALLGQLFHRLKGSAVVASEAAVADEAARLQDLCENGDARDHPEEIARGLEELVRRLEAASESTALAEAAARPLREVVSLE